MAHPFLKELGIKHNSESFQLAFRIRTGNQKVFLKIGEAGNCLF